MKKKYKKKKPCAKPYFVLSTGWIKIYNHVLKIVSKKKKKSQKGERDVLNIFWILLFFKFSDTILITFVIKKPFVLFTDTSIHVTITISWYLRMLTFKPMNGELELFQQSLSSTENVLKMWALNELSSPLLPNPLQCICSDLRVSTDFKGG